MASKRMDLNQRVFCVLSGLSNSLGKTLAIEMCRRFKSGSVVFLIETFEDDLQEVKKEIHFLENQIEVVCCTLDNWESADTTVFKNQLEIALANYNSADFDVSLILHNEGPGATQKIIEAQDPISWKLYVKLNLYAVVALNQAFLNAEQLKGLPKFVVNITSSLMVKPFICSSLMASCKKARDMYFRGMADMEQREGVNVLTYSPGIMESHQPEIDVNGNIIDLLDLNIDKKILKLPRVTPLQSSLKLINILEELSFISGHDVDYYDTFVL